MSRPSRAPAFDYRGVRRYFLTFCCRSRARVFEDDRAVASALCNFRQAAVLERFELSAFCLMPDHAHLLVEGTTDAADLRKFVKRAKQASGAAYARHARRPLWQEGYFDRVLRDEDEGRCVLRYMLNNPVRAGLVNHPAAYPHSGSDRWTIEAMLEHCH